MRERPMIGRSLICQSTPLQATSYLGPSRNSVEIPVSVATVNFRFLHRVNYQGLK